MKIVADLDMSNMSENEIIAFEAGVRSVLAIRCMNHRAVPQLNTNVCDEAECPICAMQPPIKNEFVSEGCEKFTAECAPLSLP